MVASETLPYRGSGAAEESPDRLLIQEVIGGSHDALAQLYDRHHVAVFTAAARTSSDRWLASDVVQVGARDIRRLYRLLYGWKSFIGTGRELKRRPGSRRGYRVGLACLRP